MGWFRSTALQPPIPNWLFCRSFSQKVTTIFCPPNPALRSGCLAAFDVSNSTEKSHLFGKDKWNLSVLSHPIDPYRKGAPEAASQSRPPEAQSHETSAWAKGSRQRGKSLKPWQPWSFEMGECPSNINEHHLYPLVN